jgi:hypothetical protein
MDERFFRDISENRIRRDSYTSVPNLELTVDLHVQHHNANPKPSPSPPSGPSAASCVKRPARPDAKTHAISRRLVRQTYVLNAQWLSLKRSLELMEVSHELIPLRPGSMNCSIRTGGATCACPTNNPKLRAEIASHVRRKRRSFPMIRKLASGEYRLYSRKTDPNTGKRRNLGTFGSLEQARQHEHEVRQTSALMSAPGCGKAVAARRSAGRRRRRLAPERATGCPVVLRDVVEQDVDGVGRATQSAHSGFGQGLRERALLLDRTALEHLDTDSWHAGSPDESFNQSR